MGAFAGVEKNWASLTDIGRTHIATKGVVQSGLVLNLDAGVSSSYSGSGTSWTDLSGNGNTGTLTNGPTYDSANGGSIVFDGVNDFIGCGNILNFERTNPFTISVWFRTTKSGSFTSTIVGKNKLVTSPANYTGYQIGMNVNTGNSSDAGKFGFVLVSGPFVNVSTNVMRKQTVTSTYNNGNWINGLVAYDGTSSIGGMLIYINGINVNTESPSGEATSLSSSIITNANFQVGARDGTNQPFNGNISQVSIYNRSLTASEISQNFNAMRYRFGI